MPETLTKLISHADADEPSPLVFVVLKALSDDLSDLKPSVLAEFVCDVDYLGDDAFEHLISELLLVALTLKELKVHLLK